MYCSHATQEALFQCMDSKVKKAKLEIYISVRCGAVTSYVAVMRFYARPLTL